MNEASNTVDDARVALPTDLDTTASSQCDPQSSNKASISQEQILEQYSEIIDRPEALSEGFTVQEMIQSMPTAIKEDSEWFFMPKKWLQEWELFCYVDLISG